MLPDFFSQRPLQRHDDAPKTLLYNDEGNDHVLKFNNASRSPGE